MRLGFALPYGEREHRRALLDYGRLAETLGYESLWVPEAWGSDAFTLLGALAAHTARIRLGTGIVNVFSRSPGVLAQSFATLDELSDGRAIIGLGTSGPRVIEGWHGMPFQRPVRRMREVVEILRLALGGARVDYAGEIFRLAGFTLPLSPVRPRIPIYLATFKPAGLRLTGEIADGWLPTHLALGHLPRFVAALRAGAAATGRDVAALDVAPVTLAVVAAERSVARGLAARHLAYYVGGMGTFYHEMMHGYGFAEEADRIRAHWSRGARAEAAAQVSEAMLDALVIAGTADECRAAVEARRAVGVTHLVLMPPHGTPVAAVRATLEALRPSAG